jgi:hypothetical protein
MPSNLGRPNMTRNSDLCNCGHTRKDHVSGHGCTVRLPTSSKEVGIECSCLTFELSPILNFVYLVK